jgi:hypothetical protein
MVGCNLAAMPRFSPDPLVAAACGICKPGLRPYLLLDRRAPMIQQLRIYEIFEKNKAAFHARFRDHAARIMRTKYDFRIVAMWETRFDDRTEFAYVLEWSDEAARTAGWAAFMADAEWTEIKRVTHAEHGLMVGQIEDRLLIPVDYSPSKGRSMMLAAI